MDTMHSAILNVSSLLLKCDFGSIFFLFKITCLMGGDNYDYTYRHEIPIIFEALT